MICPDAYEGEPLGAPSATSGTCSYNRKTNGVPLVTLQLYPDKTKSSFESDAKTAAKILEAKVPPRPPPGYGEAAFTIGDSMLTIFKHGKSIWSSACFPRTRARQAGGVRAQGAHAPLIGARTHRGSRQPAGSPPSPTRSPLHRHPHPALTWPGRHCSTPPGFDGGRSHGCSGGAGRTREDCDDEPR